MHCPLRFTDAVSHRAKSVRRERLQTLDVSAIEVAKLHGPVGFDIGSRTPPEIAVAIAAELILKRSFRHPRKPNSVTTT